MLSLLSQLCEKKKCPYFQCSVSWWHQWLLMLHLVLKLRFAMLNVIQWSNVGLVSAWEFTFERFFSPNVLKRWVIFSCTCKKHGTILLLLLRILGFWKIYWSQKCACLCVSLSLRPVWKTAALQWPTLGLLSSTLFLYTHFLLQGFISKLPIVYGPLDLAIQGQSHFLHSLNAPQKSW